MSHPAGATYGRGAHFHKKTQQEAGFNSIQGFTPKKHMTPTGLEQSGKIRGKTSKKNSVPPPVPPSGAINELLTIWAGLDEPARRDLLAVARGWVKVAP